MPKTDYPTVDAYIAAQPPAVQPALHEVRALLRAAMPAAEERISYQIPCFRLHGAAALYFAGYPAHYSVYPLTDGLQQELGAELAPHLSGKATIRFELDAPMPADLIRRIGECRARELAAKVKPKRSKRAAPS